MEVLDAFRRNAVNLSHIEKRPSRRENWSYVFFVDFEAHADAPAMRAALEQARGFCAMLRVLGSYPRAVRTLS